MPVLVEGFLAGAVFFVVWYFICRLLCWKSEQAYRAAIRHLADASTLSLAEGINVSLNRYAIARRGSPAHRLFIGSTTAMIVSAILLFVLFRFFAA